MQRAAIVGAGLGGIATAAHLARRGFKVDVFEKQPKPGGRCGRVEMGSYCFDAGPTLYLMPQVFARTFADLGEDVADHLDLIRVDPSYRVHFHDGSSLDLTSDLAAMQQQLEAIEPGAFRRFLSFLATGEECYSVSLDRFVGRNFRSWSEYLSPRNLPLMFRAKALQKHYSYVSRCFRDPRLRAAFSFQNMYLGLSPYDAMATYTLLQYTELAEGIWLPRGGIYRVIEALVQIAEGLGVRFHYGTAVRKITVKAGRATGVSLDDDSLQPADLVVANADLPYVYDSLLPDGELARRLLSRRYTSSAIMFYWGLKRPRADALMHHNVFVADHQYRESFDRIFQEHTLPAKPSFYVAAPTRTDATAAPEGRDALVVLVPVGRMDPASPQDWPGLTAQAREAVLAGLGRLGINGIEASIEQEGTMAPPQWHADLNLTHGCAFGLSHNFLQVGYLRPHNRHPRYANLYFVGASTHPGTGLPLVLLSARLTTQRIMEDHR